MNEIIKDMIEYAFSFIGGRTAQLSALINFMIAHTAMHIMISCSFKDLFNIKIQLKFLSKRIATMILLGVARSIDTLTNNNVIYNVVIYYFIAIEGGYILNIAKELNLPIPPQLANGLKKIGNYESNTLSSQELDLIIHEHSKTRAKEINSEDIQ